MAYNGIMKHPCPATRKYFRDTLELGNQILEILEKEIELENKIYRLSQNQGRTKRTMLYIKKQEGGTKGG